ncbi:DUF484 family protein [Guyparkeria sp. 1SP6A2]|nr:DUF484 family protein [Guyparkeria sp. 1SP6A2]
MSENVAFELADKDAESTDGDANTAERVIDYLQQHPDLLLEHPELLDHLELPGPPEPSVSLHHWQLRRWRNQARSQRRALDHLHQVAEENARADKLLHRFCEDLLTATDRAPDTLEQRIETNFEVDACRVKQIEEIEPASRKALQGWLDNPLPHCGRIHDHVRDEFFGDSLPQTGSAALIAVRPREGKAITHVIALGRHQPEGFNPAQGTHFLEQIGELAAAYLITPAD